MKTTSLRCITLAAAMAAALPACGSQPAPVDRRIAVGTAGSTTTPPVDAGQGGGPTSTTSSSSSSTGTTTTTSSTSTGAGGGPPAFSAQCSGALDCPMVPGCAQWTYDVVDDGTKSSATATVTVEQPAQMPPCSASAQFSDPDAGAPVSDTVTVQCASMTWSLGLDRSTMTVYVKADPAGLAWTPACN